MTDQIKVFFVKFAGWALVTLAGIFGMMYTTGDRNTAAIEVTTGRLDDAFAKIEDLDKAKADKESVRAIKSDVDQIKKDYYVPRH